MKQEEELKTHLLQFQFRFRFPFQFVPHIRSPIELHIHPSTDSDSPSDYILSLLCSAYIYIVELGVGLCVRSSITYILLLLSCAALLFCILVDSLLRMKEKSVCVMDASGPLGHALVDRLLRRGYTVHAATYQSESEPEPEPEYDYDDELMQHPRLKVFRADPLDYHAIADAVHGCSGLFAIFNTPQPQGLPCFEAEDMVEAEVRAAHNILEACAQTETMERVVFNSSVTAVVWSPRSQEDDDNNTTASSPVRPLDESSWSDLTFCRRFKLWHALAKTLSEKTAWALAMDRGVDMVAINAGLLTGPGLTAAHPYLKGAPDMYDHGVLVTVDVDFLADAHVAAYECPTAYGRYLCFNNTVCRPEDAAKLAQMLISPSSPRAPAPPSHELKVIPQMIHTKKLNKLMLEFTSGIYGDIN